MDRKTINAEGGRFEGKGKCGGGDGDVLGEISTS